MDVDNVTRGRLRSLLKASQAVANEIELHVVLRTIIAVAVDLVGARYGAIGVIGPDGTLEQFIHVGMPDDLVAHIGHLPEGHGILGALIEEQEPIRLAHLADDPRSSGFPQGHPAMESFLGVPMRVRNETFGNLYLTERGGGSFTKEDEELVVELAAAAGAAIDHARLFDETRRRQRWAAASAEVTAALLSDESDDSLGVLADRVARLSDAELVAVALPTGRGTLRVAVARGEAAARLDSLEFDAKATLGGRAHESGQPVLSDFLVDDDPLSFGPTMVVPLAPSGESSGVLVVSRLEGRPRFSAADLDMVADFAAQASVGLRLAAGRADRQRLAVLEDRGRIARDLHDHVIQRLFGAGLSLQAIAGSADAATAARLSQQVDALDSAITEIRTAIFTLTAQSDDNRPSVRHRIIDVLGESAPHFTEPPRLSFFGPIDLFIDGDLADDLVAAVREGLANVARHAQAHEISVWVGVERGRATVRIEDDGVGVDEHVTRSSGTGNLASRAAARGGEFDLVARSPRGTVMSWWAPLEEDA